MGSQSGGARKKLIAWVRWQLGADGTGPSYCKSCRAARKSDAACGGCPEPQALPENDVAIGLFSGLWTQWRYGPDGSRTGLDYAGMRALAEGYAVGMSPELFGQLQTLEWAVIEADAERRLREQKAREAKRPRQYEHGRQP